MSQREQPTKAVKLSLIAGILIVSNTTLLSIATTWFPQIIPILPGSSANDPVILYWLTAIGLILGALVLLCAILVDNKPVYKKVWGIMIIVSSITSVITGGGFIIGFILGIIGGVQVLRNPNTGDS